MLKPSSIEPEVPQAEALVEQLAGDLRPPVVDAGEEAEDRAAEEHVVEVGHHEVGVGLLQVHRRRGVHDPGEAAHREHRDEAEREVERGL